MPVPVVVLAELDDRARAALGNRAEGLRDDATAAVLPVLERIRRDGDAAVLEFLRDVDGVELTADRLIVDEATIAAAAASVPAASGRARWPTRCATSSATTARS